MKRNAKEDARLILELIQKGMAKKDILSKLGLNNSQFYYSLKSNCDKEKLDEIKWRLKENSAKIVSTLVKEDVLKPEIKLEAEKAVVEEIAGENSDDEKTTVSAVEKTVGAITEKVENDYQEIGKGLKKGDYVVLDTSIMGIDDVVKILKNKGVICIFTSIVIEELDKQQTKLNLCGYNAKKLLRLALEEESIVVPIPKKTSLAGWREENPDSFIVQTAFDLKEKYDPIVITSDKVLALKAKCQGLHFQYWDINFKNQKNINCNNKVESNGFRSDIPKGKFLKICARNKEISFNIFNIKNKKYIYPKKGLHKYFVFDEAGNAIPHHEGLIPYKLGYTLFIRHEHCIQKIEFKNHDKKNNANLICEAFFVGAKSGDFQNVSTLSVIESNRLLRMKK